MKQWTASLVLFGITWCAAPSWGQTPLALGNIIGFRGSSPTPPSVTVTPGAEIEFVIRLDGHYTFDGLGAVPGDRPEIAVIIGGEIRRAVYSGSVPNTLSWNANPALNTARTDVYFKYKVQPGDMADPLRLWGDAKTWFAVAPLGWNIYNVNTGDPVDWRINQPDFKSVLDGVAGFTFLEYNIDYLGYTIKTLEFVDGFCATEIKETEIKTVRVGLNGAVATTPITIKVWTPDDGSHLQIGNVAGQTAMNVSIPAGASYVDFQVKGIGVLPAPGALIYAQPLYDYDHNPAVYSHAGITNAVYHYIVVEPEPDPSIYVRFPAAGGANNITVNESPPTSVAAQIVLSRAFSDDVWVRLDVEGDASAISISTNAVRIQATLTTATIPFNVVDGTLLSQSPGVRLVPVVTNDAAAAVYLPINFQPGTVYVRNVPPVLNVTAGGSAVAGSPCMFLVAVDDVSPDILAGIEYIWDFGDGSFDLAVTNTSQTFTHTHIYPAAGSYPVTVYAKDKEGGLSDPFTLTVEVNSPVSQPKVRVEAEGNFFLEGTSTNIYVTLSHAFGSTITVRVDVVESPAAAGNYTLSASEVLIYSGQQTNLMPLTVTCVDGTPGATLEFHPVVVGPPDAVLWYKENIPLFGVLQNVAPRVTQPVASPTVVLPAYAAIDYGQPFPFQYRITDVRADMDPSDPLDNILVYFEFPGGIISNSVGFYDPASQTVTGSVAHAFTALHNQPVKVWAVDKDNGKSSEVEFLVNVVEYIPPNIRVIVQDFPYREGETATVTIRVSKPYPVGTAVTLNLAMSAEGVGRVLLPATVIIPPDKGSPGNTDITLAVPLLDGTMATLWPGVTITPSITPGSPGSEFFQTMFSGTLLVRNADPMIQLPERGKTNLIATVGMPVTMQWRVWDDSFVDCTNGMYGAWYWDDGSTTPVSTYTGQVTHVFMNAGIHLQRFEIHDKDGGWDIAMFYVDVRPSKKVIVYPLGPFSADWNGVAGKGQGTNATTTAASWTFVNNYYTFFFGATALTATIEAFPIPIPGPNGGILQSYFFVWDGVPDAFNSPQVAMRPLASGTTHGTAVIKLPPDPTTGGGGGTGTDVVEVWAVYSREYRAGDGCGDINSDGIPDWAVAQYFVPLSAAGGGGGGGGGAGAAPVIDPIWFQNLMDYNDDGDFLPAHPDGPGGVWDFRPIPPGRAFTAFLELRGEDGQFGPRQQTYGWLSDDPGTDPTKWDTDGDGFPDGWEYWFWYQARINHRGGWRYQPLNPGQGDPIDYTEIEMAFNPIVPRSAYSIPQWHDDFDNDGLLDIEELVIGTDPTNWDTDGDGMADGWEIMMGLNPCSAHDGLDWMVNNTDGDFFAIAAVPRMLLEVVVETPIPGVQDETMIITNRFLSRIENGMAVPGTYTTCYNYGDNNAPLAVGRPIGNPDLLDPMIVSWTETPVSVLIMHFQVRDEFGYDPRVAWCRAVPRFAGGGAAENAPLAALAAQYGIGRWGPFYNADAPHTRPFSAVDEYLLMKFMSELRLNGATDRMLSRGSDDWLNFSTHPQTPETAATPARASAIPDGWKLYVATRPNTQNMMYSPWSNEDGVADDDESATGPAMGFLTLQREFWGTDTLPMYANPAQYNAIIPYAGGNIPGGQSPDQVAPAVISYRDGASLTNGIGILKRGNYMSMQGVVTIVRPAGHQDNLWINKFWPTDPWNPDTDGDGLRDDLERTFIYGNPVDDGSTCIPGGGLNPCSVDTDRDGIPDAWEVCFAGSPTPMPDGMDIGPSSQTMWIRNGMDGTVPDDKEDWDNDGLVNYEEYLTQAIRAFRYDIPDAQVAVDPYSGQRGLPMDMTFEIADLFVEVTNVWDQARTRPATEGGGTLWYMMPPESVLGTFLASPRYASTDPRNPDTDADGMDDFYELYHGLNPLLGLGTSLLTDRVAWAYPSAGNWWDANWWVDEYGLSLDVVRFPWMNGMPLADPDADGLLNLEEMLLANSAAPANYNTDPSPLWMTDISNPWSLTMRFYRTMGSGAFREMYFWRSPRGLPVFMYPFEMNEGYDTDNDGISDKDELVGNRNAKSDPRNSEDPFHRQALWFSGDRSAAVTPLLYHDLTSQISGDMEEMEQAFRSFTVELWAKPQRTVGYDQVLIERVFNYGPSDLGSTDGQRRNFLIGIDGFGRVYGGFDNAGNHDWHTDSVRLYGQAIPVNQWTHVAIRMDGRTETFTLFVNGVAQDTMDTALVPANGLVRMFSYPVLPGSNTNEIIETMTISFISGSLILGAANDVLSTLAISPAAMPVTPDVIRWPATWADYSKFYQGWLDEVRVWDGARTAVEIAQDAKRRLSYEDMMANRELIVSQEQNGYSRMADAAQPMSPLLMNYYTFNSLFSALNASDVAQVPRGFNSPSVVTNRPPMTDGRPVGSTVAWWSLTAVSSTVYADKQYIPWIQNVAAHLPLYTIGALNTGLNNVIADSYYWRTDWTGTVPTENHFPNRNNPYGFTYRSIAPMADLLPIGDAFAKQCVDLWDGQGPTGTWLEHRETLDDGLPQWWLTQNGLANSVSWTDLYTGNNQLYLGMDMTNGEAYQRDLARGMQPDGSINALYKQIADSDGDGLPDWWEKLYGLDPLDPTGDNGAGGDPDMDGLSNYAEYLISEVYQFRLSSPRKFKTVASQPVSDYFMKVGRVPLGFMFSDHDFVEDWWEDLYAPGYANRFVYDPHVDYSGGGWSTWGTARYSLAVRSVRPDVQALVLPGGNTSLEVPIPIVETRLNYSGIQPAGNVVIHAFSHPDMNGQPDAVWSLAFGGGITLKTLPLGFFEPRTIETHLTPGSIVPGTISFQFTDLWTGQTASSGFDKDGILYTMPWGGSMYQQTVGTVDYVTGEISFDLSPYANTAIILDMAGFLAGDPTSLLPLDDSYVEVLYSVSLPNAWPQKLYLGQADTGYLREGTNYFLAYMTQGNQQGGGGQPGAAASWTPGDPMGLGTPWATEIGWDKNSLNIDLTDCLPGYLRMSLDGTRTEDVLFGWNSGGGGGGGGALINHVRVRRAAIGAANNPQKTVLDKIIIGRNYIHEGDVFGALVSASSAGGYALDWGIGTAAPAASSVTYDVWLMGDDKILETTLTTNGTRIAAFTNLFEAASAVATNVFPMHGGYVYSARPTLRWKMPKDYTAFAFELRKGSSSGPLLYSGIRQVPMRDPNTGDCVWEAPFYMGDTDVSNNGTYYWRIKPLNAKFSTTAGTGWSTPTMFRWDVNAPLASNGGGSSGYGQINVTVKYFGPAVSLAGKVILQAFDNRGFTGEPAAQYVFATGAPGIATAYPSQLITNMYSTATNAFLRGLSPGTYYLRAFLDSNGNGVRDIWESWGYANYYGEQKSLYNVRPVKVDHSSTIPAATIFIEDCDVDQDWFPDAWEYEQNPGAYPGFLATIGPQDGWTHGDAEINPNLVTGTWSGIPHAMGMMAAFATGSSDEQAAYLVMLAGTPAAADGFLPGKKLDLGLFPWDQLQFGITKFSINADTATLDWQMRVTRDTSVNAAAFGLLMEPAASLDYEYHVKYATSLDGPWQSIGVDGSFTLVDGVLKPLTSHVNAAQPSIDPARGFFKVEVKPIKND